MSKKNVRTTYDTDMDGIRIRLDGDELPEDMSIFISQDDDAIVLSPAEAKRLAQRLIECAEYYQKVWV